MSNFKVELLRLTAVLPHPNADKLELALVGPMETAYRCIVQKDRFKAGDLVAYIPEAAIVGDDLLDEMGLKGSLSGATKNRVKAIRLRGEVSQGLVYAPDCGWHEWFRTHNSEVQIKQLFTTRTPGEFVYDGEDIAALLGITKYVPHIPANMAGKMTGDAPSFADHTDMENIKKHSTLFVPGEMVYATEKIHGTQMSIIFDGETFKVSSKGVLHKNRATLAEEAGNLYWQAFRNLGLEAPLRALHALLGAPIQLVGEVYGKVQDLTYGMDNGFKFAAFDLRVCNPNNTHFYVDSANFFSMMSVAGIPTVPLVYAGPFNLATILGLTNGQTLAGGGHMREGIVVKPAQERNDYRHGRVILKSVSEAYLLRKGNVTEME